MDASQKLVIAKGQPHHLPRLAYNYFNRYYRDKILQIIKNCESVKQKCCPPRNENNLILLQYGDIRNLAKVLMNDTK